MRPSWKHGNNEDGKVFVSPKGVKKWGHLIILALDQGPQWLCDFQPLGLLNVFLIFCIIQAIVDIGQMNFKLSK